jgi:hypothetical protein
MLVIKKKNCIKNQKIKSGDEMKTLNLSDLKMYVDTKTIGDFVSQKKKEELNNPKTNL